MYIIIQSVELFYFKLADEYPVYNFKRKNKLYKF